MPKTPETSLPSPQSEKAAARARINEISQLFSDMSAMVRRMLAQEEPVTKTSTQKILNKLNDLQSAHMMVLRAEEGFHDKFDKDITENGFDYDTIRDDIGRALDRIRNTLGTDDISDGSEG